MKKSPALISLFVSCAISYAAGNDHYVINFNPSNGLPDISISSICQDSYNRTWVGTKRGVYYYTGYGFIALQNRDYLSKCSPNTSMVAMDGEDRLWIFTDGGSGFYNIMSDDFITIPQLNGISVTDVDFDGSGTAWITSPDGIFRFSTDDSSLSAVIEGSFMDPYKSCLLSDSRLVFTSHDDNLFFYDIEKKSLRSVSIKNATSLADRSIRGVRPDFI